ncbi:MAG: hypothetical protein ACQKBV_04265 [Puniceicoccales bacterium]
MNDLLSLCILVLLVIFLLWFATLFLRIGASWAGVAKSKNTIARALVALFLSWLVIGLLGGAGSIMPGFGNIIGAIIGVALNGLVVGAVYGEGFLKGCQIYILSIVAQIVICIVAFLVLGLVGVAVSV